MKTMIRVALVMGLMTANVTAAQAEEIHPADEVVTTQVLVMNNYLTDVRIYIEDAQGVLHNMGRLARGSLADFMVPEGIANQSFRVKVFPTALPGSRIGEDDGVKTNELHAPRDQQVRVWLEADLPNSIVEVARD